MSDYVVVDLEMTGLQVKTERIIEIGAVKISDGQIGERFDTFVCPHRSLTPEIAELTGITDEMLRDAPECKEALQAFLDFAGETTLIGHNLMFDFSFLKQNAVNCGMKFERQGIDTLKIARAVLTEPEKKSLDSLCSYFSIDRENRHRAEDDAAATAELFLILQEKYGETRPELFQEKPLLFRVKKQGKLTPAQKRDLNHLIIYHRIDSNVDLDSLTKSEASRMIDRIYATYGRIPEEERKKDV